MLTLLSLEIALFITNGNKKLALLGSIWIPLSPALQWWYSTYVLDLVIFTQAIIVSSIYFFKSEGKSAKRILLLGLFFMSGIGFVTTLYPPIQVPLGYLALIFVGYLIYVNRTQIFSGRLEWLTFSFLMVGTFIVFYRFITESWDAFQIVFNTVYPGKRFSLGGNFDYSHLNLFLINWLLPYKDVTFLNNCEVSTFYAFLPLVVALYLPLRQKGAEKQKLIDALMIYTLFQIAWLFIKFPPVIAKITLFSYVTENRLGLIVLGLISVYLSIWTLSRVAQRPQSVLTSLSIVFVIGSFYALSIWQSPMKDYLPYTALLLTIIIFVSLNYSILRAKLKFFGALMLCLIVLSGALVNPIARGTDPIFKKAVSEKILSIKQAEPDAKWVATNSRFNPQLLVALGVKTFNGVHYYPDLSMWMELDSNGSFKEVYNRMAHIEAELSSTPTTFELKFLDYLTVTINANDFEKTGIKYILSKQDYSTLSNQFELLYHEPIDNLYIYKVNSDKEVRD